MSSSQFSHLYVPAEIKIIVEGTEYETTKCLLNSQGTLPFSWTRTDPLEWVSEQITVHAKLLTSTPLSVTLTGFGYCDQNEAEKRLGIHFSLTPDQTAVFDKVIAKEGALDPMSKQFPRIVFNPSVPMMPSRVILKTFKGDEDILVVCDLEDVSASGVLVVTEDSRAETFSVEKTMRVELMPRGSLNQPITFNSTIRHITYAWDPVGQNFIYHLGLNITAIGDESKNRYVLLLREIVGRLKTSKDQSEPSK